MVEIKIATGKETISFAKDIAPVLATTCANCHGMMRPGGNFSLFTFEGLIKGGDSGSPVQSGKGADSFLIKKLRGMVSQGQRMPLNLDPLPEDVIAKIEKDTALKHLEGILYAADAIMVARGDLGVELPFEQVPLVQKRLIREAWRLGKPVITATPMLESMV